MFPPLLLGGHEALKKLLNNPSLQCDHTLSKILQALQRVHLLEEHEVTNSPRLLSVLFQVGLSCTRDTQRGAGIYRPCSWNQHVASAAVHTQLKILHGTAQRKASCLAKNPTNSPQKPKPVMTKH